MLTQVKYGDVVREKDRDNIRRVLGGEVSLLLDCLFWIRTPQGGIHWQQVYCGNKRLSKRSRQYLNKLLNS